MLARNTICLWVLAALAALVAWGCESDESSDAPTDAALAGDAASPSTDAGSGNDADTPGPAVDRMVFTGPSSDARTLVGVVVAGTRVGFYGCGSGDTLSTHSWWLFGEVGPDGTVALSDDADFSLEGRIEDDRFQGTYRMPDGGDVLTLNLPLAGPDDRSEMFELLDGECRMGVIVVDNGQDPPQIQGAWCDGEGVFLQVTPILPFAPDARGLEVSVELPDGPREFVVTPVFGE